MKLFTRTVLPAALLALASLSFAPTFADKEQELARRVITAVLHYRYGENVDINVDQISTKVLSIAERRLTGDGRLIIDKKSRRFTFSVKIKSSNGNIRDVNIDVK
ncbi:MAG: hypothetical protein KIT11_02565 [Fimbriimonadaceae bacterium]|nr:hypothetical protein [Fimbriimonadaceae bacterium]QYK54750.1 MAG: hypothetical protein KF733_06970 [Fimbriimonadaceae bacterium]